jgi:hypothetical protein
MSQSPPGFDGPARSSNPLQGTLSGNSKWGFQGVFGKTPSPKVTVLQWNKSFGLSVHTPDAGLPQLSRVTDGGTGYGETADGRHARVVKFEGDVEKVFIRSDVPIDWSQREVTEIGQNAFESLPIVTVVLPIHVTVIGARSFYGCSKLQTVRGANSLTHIGVSAFAFSAISSFRFPDSLEVIERFAFNSCGIQSFTFPAGSQLRILGESAFALSPFLMEAKIPGSLEKIGDNCFSACENHSRMEIGQSAFAYRNSEFGEDIWRSLFRTLQELDQG